MDRRTKIRGDQSFGSCSGDGFRSQFKYRPWPDGVVADGARRLHRYRYRDHPGKKAAETGVAGSDLVRRTRRGAAGGLDKTCRFLSPARQIGRKWRQAGDSTKRREILFGFGDPEE